MVPDSHLYVRLVLNHFVWPPLTVQTFMYVASPIPVPKQVISSGCYTMITGSARSVNYVLILPFHIGQFPVCSLEFIYRYRLVTLSIMSVQAYKYCKLRCSDPDINLPLTVTNTVVDRTSYGDFIRLVFYDGRLSLISTLFTMIGRRRCITGILYYIYLISLSVTNIIIIYTFPVRLFISGQKILILSHINIIVARILPFFARVSVLCTSSITK